MSEWEVVQDKLSAFQSLIRLRGDEWELHSWNIFTVMVPGDHYPHPFDHKRHHDPVEYVASVWRRKEHP